jgi:hypothetical protein
MADLSQLLYGSQAPAPEAPTGVRTPWQGLPPARADQMKQRAYEQAQKYLQDNAAVVSQGAEVLNQLEQFGGLNQQESTGEWYAGILPQFMTGTNEQVMKSITADLAPKKRIAGSGTTSDRDIALYLQSLPSIEKKGQVNKAIRENYRQQYERANAKLQFMQSYFDQYGHLNGADAMWEKQKANILPKSNATAMQGLFNQADAIIGK